MNPELINPETLDTLVDAAKVGGFVLVTLASGYAAIFAGVSTVVIK